MVSLRRRKLLGMCSGKSSFVTPLPRFFESATSSGTPLHDVKPYNRLPMPSDNVKPVERFTMMKEGLGSSNESDSSSSKELPSQQVAAPPIKRRKRHKRKPLNDQEPCLMRGVYFKNMKWQAAIKVDKKQIHLGTVGSQEEAARLYDRAAFMCGREPNFELSEEEKQELSKFKWDEFLAMTRLAITNKKQKRSTGAIPQKRAEISPSWNDVWDGKEALNLASEDVEQDTSVSSK